MSASIAWLHVGDLHLEAGDGWESLRRLETIVAEANQIGSGIDFVFLPGDNANNARADEYARMLRALEPLTLPWRTIPGDHDFEGRSISNYEAAIAAENRPKQEVFAGHRCVFLDIVSEGAGGPDFRLPMGERLRLAEELMTAKATGQTALVFMHAYPCDLAADGAEIASVLAEGDVRFVDTGHTHYNELLNDGRVVYGATRSTGQIEEANGQPGYTLVCVHDGVPSWRFRPLGTSWPALQIVSPADLRMVTRPAEPSQVPRPGSVTVTVRGFGPMEHAPLLSLDGGKGVPMRCGEDGLWRASVPIEAPGLHRLTARSGGAEDSIDVLVRPLERLPKRRLPVSLGETCHAIGAWPEAGLFGTRLGPNSNGRDW
ncbi:metallophosphoesterase [Acetobacteraceae bacterium KSS8]|uniref:Metallophosphoesterase n=1 Tax=Endosaccharibacter trunci TaxID=2812733 RepID=A0ABT1W714_9PROT|nr:metallophosphoesterase [Acetobacteraceae bacterium KSS8]